MEGGLQEPRPGETPAQGGGAGLATDLSVKTLCRKNRMLCGPRASHYQLPAGWFCDVEPTGASQHQNLVATKEHVQEDQMRQELSGD